MPTETASPSSLAGDAGRRHSPDADFVRQRLAAAWTGQPAFLDVDPHQHTLTCAAVLVPLFRHAETWHLLFTRRSDRLAQHRGQVAFPGGACEPDDRSVEETALREAEEEIGLRPDEVQILGRLNPSITISRYHLTPVVGVLPWPYAFRMQTSEVARIFSIPLPWLAQPQNYLSLRHLDDNRLIIAYRPYDGELLWGITARITRQLLALLA